MIVHPVDRRQVALYLSPVEADDGGYMSGTPEQRVLAVWDLTREAWFFFQNSDAEKRLERDVAVLIRNPRRDTTTNR